jgi:hypothetical protein
MRRKGVEKRGKWSSVLIMKKYWLLILISNASFGSTLNVGLVGQYKFDNGTAEDTSGNNNNGTAFNVTTSSGIQGGALRFNGANSIVKIGTLIPQYTTSGTIFSWYRANPNPDLSIKDPYNLIAASYQNIISQNRSQGVHSPGLFLTIWDQNYLIDQANGFNPAGMKVRAGFSDVYTGNTSYHNEYVNSTAPAVGLDGEWHSIATTLLSDSTGKSLKVFFDGSLAGSLNFGNPTVESNTNAEIFIGGSFEHNIPDSYFNGDIDNVHVYDRSLSDTEVYQLHLATVPEPSALSLLAVGLGGLALVRRRRS